MKKKLSVGILILTMLVACLGASALADSGAVYEPGHDWGTAAGDPGAFTVDEATGNVSLNRDLELGAFVQLNAGSVTVDLNGHTLSRAGAEGSTVLVASGSGELTVTNSSSEGKITGANAFIVSQDGGTISIENVEIEQTEDTKNECAIYAQNGGHVVIGEGAVIRAKAGVMVSNVGNNSLTMTGGEIIAERGAIYTNGSSNDDDDYADKQTVAVSGGTVTSTAGTAIYLPGKGASVTVSGDSTTVTGAVTGIEIRSGRLEVAGGTVTGGTGEASTGETPRGGGSVTSNAGIGVAPYARQDITVTVSGGTVKGGTALYQDTPADGEDATYTFVIEGGEFDGAYSSVSVTDESLLSDEFVSGGKFTVAGAPDRDVERFMSANLAIGSDGAVGAVTESDTIATLTDSEGNTVAYRDFVSALRAAWEGDTLTLKRDAALGASVTVAEEITLDLGGKNLTFSGDIRSAGAGLYITCPATVKNGTVETRVMSPDGQGSASCAIYICDYYGTYEQTGMDVALCGLTVKGSDGYGVCVSKNETDTEIRLTVDKDTDISAGNTSSAAAVANFGSAVIDIYGKLTMKGTGSAVNGGWTADNSANTVVNIHDGASVIGNGTAGGVLMMSNGSVTVGDGNGTGEPALVSGNSGVSMLRGSLTVNATAEITASGYHVEYVSSGNYQVHDNGAGIYVEPAGKVTVTVNGGRIASENSFAFSAPATNTKNNDLTLDFAGGAFDGVLGAIDINTDAASSAPTGFVTGGEYSSPVDRVYLDASLNFESEDAAGMYSYWTARSDAEKAAGEGGTVTMLRVPVKSAEFYATREEANEALGVDDAGENTFAVEFDEAPNPGEGKGIWFELTRGSKTVGIAGDGGAVRHYFSLGGRDHFEYWPDGVEAEDFAGDVTVSVYATDTILEKKAGGAERPDGAPEEGSQPIAVYTVNTLRIIRSGYIADRNDVEDLAPEGSAHDDWGDRTMWVEFNLPIPANEQVVIKYTASNGTDGYIACKPAEDGHRFFAWSFKNGSQTPGVDPVAGGYTFTTYYDPAALTGDESDLTEDMVIESGVAGPEVAPPAGLTVKGDLRLGYGHTADFAASAVKDAFAGATSEDIIAQTMFAAFDFEATGPVDFDVRFTCGDREYTESFTDVPADRTKALAYFSFLDGAKDAGFAEGEYTVDVLFDGTVIASGKLTLYKVAIADTGDYDVTGLQSEVSSLLATGEDDARTLAQLPATLRTTGEDPVDQRVDWTAETTGDDFTVTFTAVRHTSSSSGGGGAAVTSRVENTGNGSVKLSSTTARGGQTVTVTAEPDEGFEIGTVVVTDRSGGPVEVTRNDDGTYSYTVPTGRTPVTVSVTFVECACLRFADVDVDEWYHGYIDYVFTQGLMLGLNDGWHPADAVRRAEIAVILGRIDGAGLETGGSEWYSQSVQWAMENDITDGTNPLDSCTREQAVTMLWRYMGQHPSDHDITGYVDSNDIHDWAMTAMKWAVENGIVNGLEGNDLQPGEPLTRAQFAAILNRIGATVPTR